MTKFVSLILLVSLIHNTVAELRWCKVSDPSLSPAGDGWVQFEDSVYTCVQCSSYSIVLIESDLMPHFECCNGMLTNVGFCQQEPLEETLSCSNAIRCDGIKQCVNGSDEVGCGHCSGTNKFLCPVKNEIHVNLTSDVCISQNQVCDSRKDCVLGFDETGCQWHRGWCEGFLCGKPHERCIPLDQVCDGVKQCIDGSDEANCLYCDHQFQCQVVERNSTSVVRSGRTTRTAQCIGLFRVCDGRSDCDNGLDETNCFRWGEWSTWSECAPPVVCTRVRNRNCVSAISSVAVDPVYCYDVEDYDAIPGLPSVEQQSQICPVCIPSPPPPSLDSFSPFEPPQVDPPIPLNNEEPIIDVERTEGDPSATSSSTALRNIDRGEEAAANASMSTTEQVTSTTTSTSTIVSTSESVAITDSPSTTAETVTTEVIFPVTTETTLPITTETTTPVAMETTNPTTVETTYPTTLETTAQPTTVISTTSSLETTEVESTTAFSTTAETTVSTIIPTAVPTVPATESTTTTTHSTIPKTTMRTTVPPTLKTLETTVAATITNAPNTEESATESKTILDAITLLKTVTTERVDVTNTTLSSGLMSTLVTKSKLNTETSTLETKTMRNESTPWTGPIDLQSYNENGTIGAETAFRERNPIIRLILIIAGTAAVVAIFILIVSVVLCCCREKRRGRQGKFNLTRRPEPLPATSLHEVPRMYREVRVNSNSEDDRTLEKYVTSGNLTLTRNSGTSQTPRTGFGDSGIEDASSTSSHHVESSDHASDTTSQASSS